MVLCLYQQCHSQGPLRAPVLLCRRKPQPPDGSTDTIPGGLRKAQTLQFRHRFRKGCDVILEPPVTQPEVSADTKVALPQELTNDVAAMLIPRARCVVKRRSSFGNTMAS